MVDACDVVPADSWCGVIPCKLCLEWKVYGSTEYGSADFATSSWTGTVGGISFTSYWQRNESGEGEYIVIFGGYEVYRATCYEGASCRNPHGEVEATVGTETGTLRWSVYEPREVQLIDDPDTGCRDFFCDSCRCSCRCLCVTVTEPDNTVTDGEICDIAYECDPPLWFGTVGEFELSIQLGRDAAGVCIITATVNGEEQETVAFPGCGEASATITLYGGTTIAVQCKQCRCGGAVSLCCGGRELNSTMYLKHVPGTTGLDCPETTTTLTQGSEDPTQWFGSDTVNVEVPDAAGEICETIEAHWKFYCDGGGQVYQLAWYFYQYGIRYPTLTPEEEAAFDPYGSEGWAVISRIGEDCEYPYLGSFLETDGAKNLWNGYASHFVKEIPW